MKIIDGKMIYEIVPCWNCNGRKEVTQNILCPLFHKSVAKEPNRKCRHCGSKNKWSHEPIGTHVVPCYVCQSTGVLLENSTSHLAKGDWAKFVPSFVWSISREQRTSNFNESYLGLGYVIGSTDWGAAWAKTDEQLLKEIPLSSSPIQPHCFVRKDDRVATHMVICVRRDGYTVKPAWLDGKA